jgi:hypothetical protein
MKLTQMSFRTFKGAALKINANIVKIVLTKVLKINSSKMEEIKINGKEVEDVNEYSYLGSIVTEDGGRDDINWCIKMQMQHLYSYIGFGEIRI